MFKHIFFLFCIVALSRSQDEAESISEQSEKIVRDRTHGIDIIDLRDRRKRDSDLGEELERLQIQKQINEEHHLYDPTSIFEEIHDEKLEAQQQEDPASLYKEVRVKRQDQEIERIEIRKEQLHADPYDPASVYQEVHVEKVVERQDEPIPIFEGIRFKRQDHPHPHAVPENTIGQAMNPDQAQSVEQVARKRDLIGIGSDLDEPTPTEQNPAEITIETTTLSTPIEQMPAPTDSIDNPKILTGHGRRVSKVGKSSSTSEESKEEEEVEGRKVQNVPPRPTAAEEFVEATPELVKNVPPKPEEPTQNIKQVEIEERLKLKRDVTGLGSDLHKEKVHESPAKTPDEATILIRARRYLSNDEYAGEEEI